MPAEEPALSQPPPHHEAQRQEAQRHGMLFSNWVAFNGKRQSDIEVTALATIRLWHQDCHVTRTTESYFDLFGYAKAGHATATPADGKPRGYDATRRYNPPAGTRLETKGQPGTLTDRVNFGRWSYEWQGNSYVVYRISHREPRWGDTVRMLFVLSPAGPAEREAPNHPATDALLLAVGAWSQELHDEIEVFDGGSWIKDKELYASVRGSSWDDVVLDPALKAGLVADVVGFFDSQQAYRSLGVPWKRGVIFHGVPGNGKTVSIKALINQLAQRRRGDDDSDPVPSLYVKALESCRGPKWSIREIFRHARGMAPCLLIFEDLDSLVGRRTRSYFLNEVDGLESNEGILMIGSTNHLDRLDPAITKRPSRFDRKYHFGLPDLAGREAYAAFWARKLTVDDAGDNRIDFPGEMCRLIAEMTDGFSFAYLKELFVTSLLTLARGGYMEPPEEEEKPKGEGEGEGEEEEKASEDGFPADEVLVETPEKKDCCCAREKGKTKKDKTKPKKQKRVMPEVQVPDRLKENLLLKIVAAQAKILLEQMNESEEDEEKDSRYMGRPGDRCPPFPQMYDSDEDCEDDGCC